jgi:hypothetical protein
LIPWTVNISVQEDDKQLGEKLKAEAPGILASLVRACLRWQKDGLTVPKAVLVATEQYRGESDTFGAFLEECCTLGPTLEEMSADLFKTYTKWADEGNQRTMNSTRFGIVLAEHGFRKSKANGVRGVKGNRERVKWSGLELKEDFREVPGGASGMATEELCEDEKMQQAVLSGPAAETEIQTVTDSFPVNPFEEQFSNGTQENPLRLSVERENKPDQKSASASSSDKNTPLVGTEKPPAPIGIRAFGVPANVSEYERASDGKLVRAKVSFRGEPANWMTDPRILALLELALGARGP